MIRWRDDPWCNRIKRVSRRHKVYMRYGKVEMCSNLGVNTLFIPIQVAVSQKRRSQCNVQAYTTRKVICKLLYGWKKV